MPDERDFEADDMAPHNQNSLSHLFLVRLWMESNNEGDNIWCGRVQHVTKGRANQFKDWPTLIDVLRAMLPDAARVRQHQAVHEAEEE
jgi:hypothetical protein